MTVDTDLTIAGRIAQFGSGMIKEVSAKLLGQFVQCLEGRLGGVLPVAGVTEGQRLGDRAAHPVPAAAPAPAAQSVPAGARAAEPAPLDLMSVAGRAIYKRLVPAAAGLVIVAVIIYLIVR